METLGKLEEIKDLRTVWAHEAGNFTKWIEKKENICLLSDALGKKEFTDIKTELYVGKYRLDVFAIEKDTGKKIIIENQLEDTNHDHLGKIITYASGKSANIIIWLVKNANEEHRAAVEWLNNHTDETIEFFLCEIRLYSIDGSRPAVKFEIIARPNVIIKNFHAAGESALKHYEYWANFQKYASHNKEFAENFSCNTDPSSNRNMNFSIGGGDVYFVKIWQADKNNDISAEFFSRNEDLIIKLREKKDVIESATNLHFDWSNEKRISIKKSVSLDDVKIFEQFDWLIDVMLKIKKSFTRYL